MLQGMGARTLFHRVIVFAFAAFDCKTGRATVIVTGKANSDMRVDQVTYSILLCRRLRHRVTDSRSS